MVFHDLRKRFHIDDRDYMVYDNVLANGYYKLLKESLAIQPPTPMDSPGRSGATFFSSGDKKLVIKSLNSEEVALLHQILQPYHAVSRKRRERERERVKETEKERHTYR